MRKIILFAAGVYLIAACNLSKPVEQTAANAGDSAVTSPQASTSAKIAPSPASDPEVQKILGSYVGAFGDNKITLLITKVGENTISGRSIVAGNDRPFDGTFTVDNAVYSVVAAEPGDDKHDGVFKFSVASSDPSQVKGTWKSNDPKQSEKSYVLDRRKFQYRADVGNWPESSTRVLKTSDVENLAKGELEFMRNEIFARHGYCFNKRELRRQFENEDWYVPNTIDIKGYLTDIEKKNISLIKRYEKYAEDSDEYGR